MMSNKDEGLIQKYRVERMDGKPVEWAFVLQDTDPLTPIALRAYGNAAYARGYAALAIDLWAKADAIDAARAEQEDR